MQKALRRDELLASRMLIYRTFQTVFGNALNAETLKSLAQAPLEEARRVAIESVPSGDDESYYSPLFEEFVGRITGGADAEDALRSQYTRLFVGPGKLVAPPWESVYRSSDGLLFQPSTLDVRRAFRTQGFEPQALHRMPDDHIGLELDLMAKLAQRAYEAKAAGRNDAVARALDASLAFLQEHLLVWVPRFAEALNQEEAASFYRQAARALCEFLGIDAKLLKMLIDLSRFGAINETAHYCDQRVAQHELERLRQRNAESAITLEDINAEIATVCAEHREKAAR